MGFAGSGVLHDEARWSFIGACVGTLFLAAAVMLVAFAIHRSAAGAGAVGWIAVIFAAYVSAGVWYTLPPDDLHYFGTLSTFPPNAVWKEEDPVRPAVTYRTNALGFRTPAPREDRDNNTIRIVLIGDSYVFGIGVEEGGTLRAQLQNELRTRWPERDAEVINLGLPGDNIASHVELFTAAHDLLDPDVVVFCLTLPNDLSRWDDQAVRHAMRRFSAFSVARFLLGNAAADLWGGLFLEDRITERGLAHLDTELHKLLSSWQAATPRPILLLFSFMAWDTPVRERLEKLRGVAIVPSIPRRVADAIPRDGHPTTTGNQRSAESIVRILAELPEWQSLPRKHAADL